MTMYRLLPAMLAALTSVSPAAAALTLGIPAGPAITIAAPPLLIAAEPAAAPVPPVENGTEVSGGVLLGMAFAGLVIVGIAARRRQPGVSVTS